MADSQTIERDYSDNFSVKEFAEHTLVPKYFSDIDPSLRTVGMIGYTTEQLSNISEDVFNSVSVLFRETFPNRAQLPESIYSHAALFQLSSAFSNPASCLFILSIEEESIINNMQNNYDVSTGIYHFYIDKNTIIYVEDIPYTLDYDIDIRVVKKNTENGTDYIFSASYLVNDYNNSISSLTSPYIKIRHANGKVTLEVRCHQCKREISYEPILTNSVINYPTINIDFDQKLAGIDILYRKPSETNFNTQLTPLVEYSKPITSPFCYFQMTDENSIRITFNTKDDYFSPEYGGELKIILYTTSGEDGNFDVYSGNRVSVIPAEDVYVYSSTIVVTAQSVGASTGGKNHLSLDELQMLTVQGYRTANSLTTDQDLNEFFNNFKILYGNSWINFIKMRDDFANRIYSAFIVMKNGDYIYKTNTLSIEMNLSDMENPEESLYTIHPGTLFYSDSSNPGYVNFLRDWRINNEMYAQYIDAVHDGTIPFIETPSVDIPAELNRSASFAEFKRRKGVRDTLTVFNHGNTKLEEFDDPQNGKFLYVNPFLIRFSKNPNLVSMYMTTMNQISVVDFVEQNTDSFVQFIMYQIQGVRDFSDSNSYRFKISLVPSISIDNSTPIVDMISETNEDGAVTEKYILGDKFNTVNNDLRVFLVFNDGVNDICYTELYPTEYSNEMFIFEGQICTDDHITSNGKLRILENTIYRNPSNGEYYKVYAHDSTKYIKYDKDGSIIEDNIPVDTVTLLINNGTIKKWSETVNLTVNDDILIPMADVNCKIYTTYRRLYSEIDGKLILTDPDQTNNMFVGYDSSMSGYIWTNHYSTQSQPLTFIHPLNFVRSSLEFKDYTIPDTSTLSGFKYDIMDVSLNSLPLIRWTEVTDSVKMKYFMNSFVNQYNSISDIVQTKLRGLCGVDLKFYNTYGCSKNFTIGEEGLPLNTVNMRIVYNVWFLPGTDTISAIPELQSFIKDRIENLNSDSVNSIYNSNMMRMIETTFSYVDHIQLVSINKKDQTYQTVKCYKNDLNEMTLLERRSYVPEMLVIDKEDIVIIDYYV